LTALAPNGTGCGVDGPLVASPHTAPGPRLPPCSSEKCENGTCTYGPGCPTGAVCEAPDCIY